MKRIGADDLDRQISLSYVLADGSKEDNVVRLDGPIPKEADPTR